MGKRLINYFIDFDIDIDRQPTIHAKHIFTQKLAFRFTLNSPGPSKSIEYFIDKNQYILNHLVMRIRTSRNITSKMISSDFFPGLNELKETSPNGSLQLLRNILSTCTKLHL
jgi:hypothetical protein